MNAPGFPPYWAQLAPFAVNHLWQSTLFAGATALLTLGFRDNKASLRHGLWFAASVKFLVPFALLVSLGTHLWSHRTPVVGAQQTVYLVLSQPFAPVAGVLARGSGLLPVQASAIFTVWLVGVSASLGLWFLRLQAVRITVRQAVLGSQGRELAALRRMERLCGIRKSVELRLSPPGAQAGTQALAPGIFGIRKPVLLWPATLTAHLDDRQLDAIVAHELAHIRRRDNLLAAMHMVVQALFWFHPLVPWIGRRLLAERERACDEAALLLGGSHYSYAEAILSVCKFYAEPSTAHFSGVSGGISAILTKGSLTL